MGHEGAEPGGRAVRVTARDRFLSPSSRLVGAMVLLALIALALMPSTGPATATGTTHGTSTEAPSAVADVTVPTQLASAPDLVTASPAATALRTAGPKARATPKPTSKPTTCQPTDQDRYVYNPDRLEVVQACVYATGVIEAVRREADGDLHMLLALDPAYRYLLTPANQGEELGDLVIEPVCVKSVTQTDAIDECAADPDPLPPPYPAVGEHVWMEGRYVYDLDHGAWAELHPLYRWGLR